MELYPVSSSSSATTNDASTSSTDTLGKDAFLKLLTAQLANQDPLEPVDNQAFIAQLAQFSSLEQLQGVSSRLDSLLLATTSSTQLNTASLVGKDVTFRASSVDVTEGVTPKLQAEVAAPATVTALIQSADGSTPVRAITLTAQAAGTLDLGWDGKDGEGNALPTGTYSVSISARAADGSSVDVQTTSGGTVQGISYAGGTPTLLVGSSQVQLSNVVTVRQSTTTQSS